MVKYLTLQQALASVSDETIRHNENQLRRGTKLFLDRIQSACILMFFRCPGKAYVAK